MTDPHATLVQTLRTAGLLDDPAWHEAFTAIPRHHFLPHFYSASGDTWRRLNSASMSKDDWCRLAYHDRTWVVRLSGPLSEQGQPASSSIQPSLAARMLEELAVTDNSNVLEIGTGTGYLTALLCHRVGASHVTSIDIDPELVSSAGRLLAQLGYTPRLATADGCQGHPELAPYDRVLGTAAVHRIPQTWINQTRPGGRIVTPLRSAIAVIEVHDNRRATGRFLPIATRVLPLRTHIPNLPARPSPQPRDTNDQSVQPRTIPVGALYDENFRFLLDVAIPGIEYDHQGPLGTLIVRHPDNSTTQISPTGQAQQHGPRRLRDEIAAIYDVWYKTGNPRLDRYRLTIGPHDQTIWLDDHSDTHHWTL